VRLNPLELFRRSRRVAAVASAVYRMGDMISLNSAGAGVVVTGATGLKIVGAYYDQEFTAVAGNDIEVLSGIFSYANSETDPVTIADLENIVFAEGRQTISRTSQGGTLSPCGRLVLFSEDSVPYVMLGGDLLTGFSSVDLQSIALPLFSWREVDSSGDVGNIAAIGGVLASNSTPILRADAAESPEISWAATNADPIAIHTPLPPDFSGASDVLFEAWVYTDNAGGGDIEAASFTLESTFDGGALVSDALTDATPAATVHKVTATIAKADVPDTASYATFYLTPGTHANDPIQLVSARLRYRRN
jgi:hypothetical protein